MKTQFVLMSSVLMLSAFFAKAQTNTFPPNGNVGIGTLTPATDLQVIGTTRMGSTNNYAQVDGGGNLSFKGSAVYKVGSNKYAFQYSASPGYGLFFNSTDVQYEFRDAAARPVFYVNADNGNGFFLSGVRIGNSALTTTGNLRWNGSDFQGYNGSTWLSLTGGQSWSLKGNANTDPSINFIGTTDNKPLIFKVNNTVSGYVAYGKSNTIFGYEAQLVDTDVASTAFGYQVLRNNLGLFNVAMGNNAMQENISGAQNTAIGANALRDNISGSDNTALGHLVLTANTSGHENTGAGNAALAATTTGFNNSAFGNVALAANTTGTSNTAVGNGALWTSTIGSHNTAVGASSLSHTTTGNDNTAVGYQALWGNTSGESNVAVGIEALYDITTGLNNVGVGNIAGRGNQTGSNNTSIGYNTTVSGDFSNNTTLGYQATGTANNQVRIGNASVTSIGGYKGWTNLSDGRVKKNIKENVPGLSFIKLLKPVTYNLDLDAAEKITAQSSLKDKDARLNDEVGQGKIIQPSQEEINARRVQEEIVSTGFIAQDVEAAAKKLGYDFDGVDAPKNDKDLYGLRYSEFVVPLVKAVQELSEQNDELKKNYESKIDALQKQIDDLKAIMTSNQQSQTNSQQVVISSPLGAGVSFLQQNIPNPSNGSTVIRYYLPSETKAALLQITDNSGRIVKTFSLSQKGSGQVIVDRGQLQPGNYFYTLVADGKKIATKQMVLLQ